MAGHTFTIVLSIVGLLAIITSVILSFMATNELKKGNTSTAQRLSMWSGVSGIIAGVFIFIAVIMFAVGDHKGSHSHTTVYQAV